ncbi:MAG: dipeptide epimerase [Flavobacteriaceae bacterium]|nr:dipeptide epimerase [Flavobacteriaceae bacterium]MDZ4149219.1 dipeptide epimerase [Flavobacteriaceae bacterium]
MELILRTYPLKLKHTFTISRESHDIQPSLIVELKHEGISGFGEATTNPYYGITLENMQTALKNAAVLLETAVLYNPEDFWVKSERLLHNNYFALCALDMAFNDWYARRHGKKLYELWDLQTHHNPLTNYTIGIDTLDKMVEKLLEKPWPIYKIKLGTKNDLDIVRELRKHTSAIFRVDANCGWTVEETLQNAREMKPLGVEFIEQPLPADNLKGAEEVFKKSELPIMADESCIVESDVAKCHGLFHGINVKLTKCGGLTPARRMLAEARQLGLKTMVGCMTESTVGISAIAHLLPLLDYVDMDGALLLETDIANGVTIGDGKIFYATLPGTGVTLYT